jgi:prepilin-type N-terminal cleavage/methylation domain-containing protein
VTQQSPARVVGRTIRREMRQPPKLIGCGRPVRSVPRCFSSVRGSSDGGFTLVEVLVASMVIATVMTALTTFFVTTMTVMHQQRDKQTAIEVAASAIEEARAVDAANIGMGRDVASATQQWNAAPAAVEPYLADSALYLPAGAPAAADPDNPPAVPATPMTKPLNGLNYVVNTYVGRCWQKKTGGACRNVSGDPVPFFRVVVAVSWPDRHCALSTCYYVASTLISAAMTDPQLDTNKIASLWSDGDVTSGDVLAGVVW